MTSADPIVKLGHMLKRIGAEVAKETKSPSGKTLFLRMDPQRGSLWSETVAAFLLGSGDKPWKADVSKSFFVSGGAVRYLWRIVLSGEVPNAIDYLSDCVLQVVVAHAPEVTSVPLIGRVNYPFDPANGKIKGGHGWGGSDSPAGDRLVSQAFAGGGK